LIAGGGLSIEEGASIQSTAERTGNSGSIDLSLANGLSLRSITANPNLQSAILTSSKVSTGGDVTIDARGGVSMNNAQIISSVEAAEGNGGNIDINTPSIDLRRSLVLARAVQGNGGTISIKPPTTSEVRFVSDQESALNADSQAGVDGEISIQDPDTDVSALVRAQDVRLSQDPVLESDLCSQNRKQERSSFAIQDSGGLPPAPDQYLSAEYLAPVAIQPYDSHVALAVTTNTAITTLDPCR